jgi:hypothetical protein
MTVTEHQGYNNRAAVMDAAGASGSSLVAWEFDVAASDFLDLNLSL